MPEVMFIDYAGKRILLMDFVRITDAEQLSALVDESIRLVHAVNVRYSVLGLMDLSDTRIDRGVMACLKRLSRNNGPYVKAMTFVGLGGIWTIIVNTMLRVTKRQNHKVLQTRSEALEWLVHQ